jgi:hypothetical protein
MKFKIMDLNKDGTLTEDETSGSLEKFQSSSQKEYGEGAAKNQANRIKNRYKNADKNRDGKVTKDEYKAYMKQHQANFDRDGDGIISKDEYRTDGEKLPSTYMRKPKTE